MPEILVKEEKATAVRDVLDRCRAELSAIVGKSVVLNVHIKMSQISADTIVQLVCSSVGIRYSDIVSKSRDGKLVMARQIIWFLCRHYCGLNDEANGKLCNRDRTTVTHAFETINNMIDTGDEQYTTHLRSVENKILKLTMEKL